MANLKSVVLMALSVASLSAGAHSLALSGLEHSTIPGVDITLAEKIQRAVNACKPLSAFDAVVLESDIAVNVFTYPWNGSYKRMQESTLTLSRTGENGEQDVIKLSTSWDFDLPMPRLELKLEASASCEARNF